MTSITRRTALQGAAALAGTGLLVGCAAEDDVTVDGLGGAEVTTGPPGTPTPLAALADLPMGTAVAAELDGDPVLLVRTAESTVKAYSAVCPHSGCTVNGGSAQLVCPCHGSAFTLDGELVNGPAKRGLAAVEVTVVDGQVLPA